MIDLGRIVTILLTMTIGAAGAYERPEKKLVEYGWDVPYPDDVREHIREMETKPFDGLIFRLRTYNHAFDPRPWPEAELQTQIDTLAGIEWETFTDNFLCLYAANHWGMDWADDAQWETIVANLKLTAHAAVAGRCVGICFDPEPYGPNPWTWSAASGRSFEEASELARRRGRQFMEALSGELPSMRLLLLYGFNLFAHLAILPDDAARQAQLQQHSYALYPAFINGWLDVLPPTAQIIDGNESSYYYTDSESYFAAYHSIRQTCLSLVAPENRARFDAGYRAGMALYVDQVLALRDRKVIASYLEPAERLAHFEHNVYWALRSTDRYVWLYSEKMNWWKGPVPEGLEAVTASARAKVAEHRPLGIDLRPLIEAARARQRQEQAARLVDRSAAIPALGELAPPTLDGGLDDPCWQRPALEPFLPNAAGQTDRPKAATTAWVTYDDERLYIAFRCEEPAVAKLHIAGEQRDDVLWEGDTVELFLSTGPQATPYRHFIVNPKGVQWDGESTAAGDSGAWNAEWQSVCRIGENEWTAELAIPWAAIGGKPAAGTTRRANLCRARVAERELSSWCPVVTGFVEPDRFGTWTF